MNGLVRIWLADVLYLFPLGILRYCCCLTVELETQNGVFEYTWLRIILPLFDLVKRNLSRKNAICERFSLPWLCLVGGIWSSYHMHTQEFRTLLIRIRLWCSTLEYLEKKCKAGHQTSLFKYKPCWFFTPRVLIENQKKRQHRTWSPTTFAVA